MKSIIFSPHHLLRFSFFLALIFVFSGLSAQDRILLKNGNSIDAKVVEIQVAEVKYRRFDNPGGPVYTLLKSEIFMITYENGSKEVMADQSSAQKRQAAPATHPGYRSRTRSYAGGSAFRRNLALGGLTIPLKSDGTKLGFFAGYEHGIPLQGNFSLLTHASFSLNKYVYEDYFYYYKFQEFNSRILLGPMLNSNTGGATEFYGALLIGTDFQTFSGDSDAWLSFAYGGGLGMTINGRLDINLRFIHHTATYATPFMQIGAGVRF